MGPRQRVDRSFLHFKHNDAVLCSHFASSSGALLFSVLLSQDAGQAAHALSSSDEEQASHGAQLERGVQSVGEAPAAHEL
jgi:hypothetical protein